MKILTRRIFPVLLSAVLGTTAMAQMAKEKPATTNKMASASGYHLLNKIEIGGEGGWDYLFADADAHRLYVSHGTKFEVIDTEANKKVGEITGFKGVHGAAIASEFGRGFISDGRDDSVTIFDTKTLKNIQTVKVGKNPDCIIYDPASKRVFAFNRGSSSVSAIDAKTGKVDGTIDLGGHPEFAASDGKGMVYVNLDDKSEVVPIDAKKLTANAHWSLAPEGEDPSGMAIDTKTNRLFIVCGNKKMVVVNAATGKVISAIATGAGTDAAGFDEKEKLAFASNGDGTLTVVREDSAEKFSLSENVTTQSRARTMALDTKISPPRNSAKRLPQPPKIRARAPQSSRIVS